MSPVSCPRLLPRKLLELGIKVYLHFLETRAAITLAVIFIFSIAYNFCRFWEYQMVGNEISGLLRDNQLYMILYQNISMLLSQFVLPLLVLCILNLQVSQLYQKLSIKMRPQNF
jgi:hypothetical protein